MLEEKMRRKEEHLLRMIHSGANKDPRLAMKAGELKKAAQAAYLGYRAREDFSSDSDVSEGDWAAIEQARLARRIHAGEVGPGGGAIRRRSAVDPRVPRRIEKKQKQIDDQIRQIA